MRPLTPEEESLISERRSRFDAFFEDMMPILSEFAEDLGLANPQMIVADPGGYVEPISHFMRDQVVSEDDRVWIITRLGYFIGEVLIKRLGGCWFLNEWPETRYFLRYVVGQFDEGTRTNAMVDPFEAATGFIAQPPGRNLGQFINEIEAACRG